MPRRSPYPPELREKAVRMVAEVRPTHTHKYAAIKAVAAEFGVAPDTVRKWVRQAEMATGTRPGLTPDESAELRRLRAEVRELRRANEILTAASTFFRAELDRPHQISS